MRGRNLSRRGFADKAITVKSERHEGRAASQTKSEKIEAEIKEKIAEDESSDKD